MTQQERRALVESYLGKTVKILIDRPIGYVHEKKKYTLTYPINYGYIPEVLGGDGEELDVYLLGVNEPVSEYTAKIIGAVYRRNDVEDKLIAAPEGTCFDQAQIAKEIHFQEQYYDTYVDAIYQRSAGVIVYRRRGAELEYLCLLQKSGYHSVPKGHVEAFETDREAALRETLEETGLSIELCADFRIEAHYDIPGQKKKTLVLFLAECTGEACCGDGVAGFSWLGYEDARHTLPEWYGPALEAVQRRLTGHIFTV